MLFHQLEDNLWCTKRRKQFGHFCEHNLALSSFLWLNMSIVAEQHCLTINVCSSLFQQHCSALMKHQRFNVPSTVQYSTAQYSTMQYITVQYKILFLCLQAYPQNVSSQLKVAFIQNLSHS